MSENSKNIQVVFTPWEINQTQLLKLHIWEGLGGVIPGGNAELIHLGDQDVVDKIVEDSTGLITVADKNPGGLTYTFGVFITGRKFINNNLYIEFICLPSDSYERAKNFYTSPGSATYDNIDDAIDVVWPKNKNGSTTANIEVGTDSTNIPVFRDNETGADFLRRICFSWRKDTVFAFSWDGLIIKDRGQEAQRNIKTSIGGNGIWRQSNVTSLKYNKETNYSQFNPWKNENKDDSGNISISTTGEEDYTKREPKKVTSYIQHNEYRIIRPDYEVMSENDFSNRSFIESGGYSKVVLVGEDMPNEWKLGDVVRYKRVDDAEKDIEPMKYIVARNELFYSQAGASEVGPHGYAFEWTTTLWGLEKLKVSEELNNE